MMDVADVQDSRMPGVTLEACESPVAFAYTSQLNDGFALKLIPLLRMSRNHFHFHEIVGKSEAVGRVLEQIETVAPADSIVLIYGETGTTWGATYVAR